MIIDYATIVGRAAWCRHAAGFIGAKPPYSTRHLLETVFKKIAVSGAELPKGVSEMAVSDKGRRALYYNKRMPHSTQRVGLVHGLYHHLSDIKDAVGLRECNLLFRKLATNVGRITDPVEISCDLFAAEVLIPFDVLDTYAPDVLFPRDPKMRAAVDDEVDHISSKFNVPKGFMRWRLYDLAHFRKTHYSL